MAVFAFSLVECQEWKWVSSHAHTHHMGRGRNWDLHPGARGLKARLTPNTLLNVCILYFRSVLQFSPFFLSLEISLYVSLCRYWFETTKNKFLSCFRIATAKCCCKWFLTGGWTESLLSAWYPLVCWPMWLRGWWNKIMWRQAGVGLAPGKEK